MEMSFHLWRDTKRYDKPEDVPEAGSQQAFYALIDMMTNDPWQELKCKGHYTTNNWNGKTLNFQVELGSSISHEQAYQLLCQLEVIIKEQAEIIVNGNKEEK